MRKALVGITIAVAVIVLIYIVSVTNLTPTSNTAGSRETSTVIQSGYYIEIFVDNKLVNKITLNDLKTLPTVSFIDSFGKKQEGPYLRDVLKKYANITHFKYVIIKGVEETSLNSTTVLSDDSYIILDFTKKNTVKLCGSELYLPRENWVRNVTEIRVYG